MLPAAQALHAMTPTAASLACDVIQQHRLGMQCFQQHRLRWHAMLAAAQVWHAMLAAAQVWHAMHPAAQASHAKPVMVPALQATIHCTIVMSLNTTRQQKVERHTRA